MRVIIQRISQASVTVKFQKISQIGPGFLIFIAATHTDTKKDVDYLVKKITNLRIMNDEQDKMNKTLAETGGEVLIVSQFTLYADTKKGNRPSFIQAAQTAVAKPLYDLFVSQFKTTGVTVKTGQFRAMMKVSLVNDGPVTILIDSRDNISGELNRFAKNAWPGY